jgi:prepilin-type N-terminal cleavage/methylation domain-containing protein
MRTHKRRSGFTLIEMLAVIATTGALMAVAVGILHLLLRTERVARDERRRQTAIARLADQFRRDVHAATQFAPLEGSEGEAHGGGWQFDLGENRTVRYVAQPGELVRRQREGDDLVHRESYVLPDDAAVAIEPAGESAPGIVRLCVVPEATHPRPAIPYATCVVAQLAKDRRYLKQQNP